MRRVTGIGGIFFKAKDPAALHAWYKRHLGIDVQEWGGAIFRWTDDQGHPIAGTTVWSVGSAKGDQFAPSTASFMVNYRVEDARALAKVLREEGCNVLDKIDESEYGVFAWVIDPEGNKIITFGVTCAIEGTPMGAPTARALHPTTLGAALPGRQPQGPPVAAPDFSAARRLIREDMARDSVPGLAEAVARGDSILWEEGFGWADRDARVSYRVDLWKEP